MTSMHVPTLLLVVVVGSFAWAAALAYVAYPRKKDLFQCALAMAMHGVAYVCYAQAGKANPVIPFVLGNGALAASLALLAEVVVGLLAIQPRRWLLWAPVVALPLGFSFFLSSQYLGLRVATGSVVFGAQISCVMWLLRRPHPALPGRGRNIVLSGFALVLLIFVIRFLGAISTTQPSQVFGAGSVLQTLTFMSASAGMSLVVLGLVLMSEDRLSKALSSSNAFVRDILASMHSQIVVLSPDGQVVTSNQPRWDQVDYLRFLPQWIEGDPAHLLAGIQAVLDGRSDGFACEQAVQGPPMRWFMITVNRMHGTSGAVVVHTDITSTMKAEQFRQFRSEVLAMLTTGCKLEPLLNTLQSGVERLVPGARCQITLDTVPESGQRYPIVAADQRVLGALVLTTSPHDEGEGEQGVAAWMRQTADLASVAIEYIRANEARVRSEAQYRLLVEHACEGIVVAQDGRVRFANPMLLCLLGFEADEVVGHELLNFVHEDDRARVRESYNLRIQGRAQGLKYPLRVLTRDRGMCWFEISGTQFEWEGRPATLNFLTDIQERVEMESQIRSLAYHDSLTQLPNRVLMRDRLKQVLASHKRVPRYGALMFLDLDRFKPVNDAHGHVAGDLVLIEVAQRLRDCVRETDTVARFGGDEFVIMLADLHEDRETSLVLARGVADKVLRSLSEPYQLSVPQDDGSVQIVTHEGSASIGLVLFHSEVGKEDRLLQRADSAMYRAKDEGRHVVVLADEVSPGD